MFIGVKIRNEIPACNHVFAFCAYILYCLRFEGLINNTTASVPKNVFQNFVDWKSCKIWIHGYAYEFSEGVPRLIVENKVVWIT